MANEWDDFAESWDTPETQRYADMAFDSWDRLVALKIPNLASCRILDFGCGTGLLSEKLAGICAEIVAIDTSEKMIAALDRKVKEKGIDNIISLTAAIDQSTIRSHSCLTEKFDVIVASSVCSFLPDYRATLSDLSSLLKPGGWFTQWDWESDMPAATIRRGFEMSGLASISIETIFDFKMGEQAMPVIMGISRRWETA